MTRWSPLSAPRGRGGTAAMLAALGLLAACAQSGGGSAPVEFRGSAPGSTGPAATPGPSAAGSVIAYDGYEAAVAREGDSVADVARRVGLSGGELGAYNGLQPGTSLRAGDELVLPPRPGGYGGRRVGSTASVPQVPGGTGTGTGSGTAAEGTGQRVATAPTRGTLSDGSPIAAEPLPEAGGTTAASDGDGGFSVDAIAAAIDRPAPDPAPAGNSASTAATTPAPTGTAAAGAPASATGTAGTSVPGEGRLTPPPSASQPLPPEPRSPRTPASPELGRTQTDGPAVRPAPATVAAERAAEEAERQAAAEVALAESATGDTPAADDLGIRFLRPVSGDILVPYNVTPGGTRNEGVDFAAEPGSPIVAAAAGEVALVSQSLGGLGTIVLIRHQNDVLTVYGRVDDVTVSKGSRVQAGQPIGVVAPGDGAGPPKMHFEIRRGAESVNPELYL